MKFSVVIQRSLFYGAKGNIFEAASILRKNMTLAELILWKKLKDKRLINIKFRRQHPIDRFIVDFYCHEKKLVIEIDGEVHSDGDIKKYDLGRTSDLEKYGIKILRFSNDQVRFNMDFVLTKIQKELQN